MVKPTSISLLVIHKKIMNANLQVCVSDEQEVIIYFYSLHLHVLGVNTLIVVSAL